MQNDTQIIEENAKLAQIIERLSAIKDHKLKAIKKAEIQLAILKQQHSELKNQVSKSQQPIQMYKSPKDSPIQEKRNQSLNAIEYDISCLNPQISHNDNILYDYSKITYNGFRQSDKSELHHDSDSRDEYYDYNGYLRKFLKKKEYVKLRDPQSKNQTKKGDPDTRTVISDIKNIALHKGRK